MGIVVYKYISYICIQATSWLYTLQFLQKNTCAYILCNQCGPLQMLAGIVKFTFMAVAYSLEVLCIRIYLCT